MITAPEILAPAGSAEQLTAAVRSGADAVYLGAEGFNARRNAANFTRQQLAEAVAYCHERDVKVYLALNTLVSDKEIPEAMDLLYFASSLHVDAVIVQDLGLAALIRRHIPSMPLHASTQMSVHTPEGVLALRELGFTRVVLSRELSLEEIAQIASVSDTELEVFVHGALCMSVSGQCYMSAMLGSRSGNRGLCAQPCRLPFKAGSFENCLSLKDNSLISDIGRLCAAGVCSLKIEGRMKRPEYCAAAVTACRLARDTGSVPSELTSSLRGIFSRSGFTDGYLTAKRGKAMFGTRSKEDSADLSKAISSLRPLYRNEFRRVPLSITLSSGAGSAELRMSDGERTVTSSCPLCRDDVRPISAKDALSRLSKTGGTPYYVDSADTDLQDISLRASELNALRRECIERLSTLRSAATPLEADLSPIPVISQHIPENRSFRAVFRSYTMLPDLIPDSVERIYVPLGTPLSELSGLFSKFGVRLAVEYPRGSFGSEEKLREQLALAHSVGINEVMVHGLGAVRIARSLGMEMCGGFGLNIMNAYALSEYASLGISCCELSFELTASAIRSLGGSQSRGVIAYGHLPLMLTRNCPAALGGCRSDENCRITDRMGIDFPVACINGCSEVYNSVPLYILDKLNDFPSADRFFLRFTFESRERISDILSSLGGVTHHESGGFTRGLYYRGVL